MHRGKINIEKNIMSKSKADGTIREPVFPVEIPAGAGVIPDLGATRAVIPAEIQEAAVIKKRYNILN